MKTLVEEILNLDGSNENSGVISFVGAGGKTTIMFSLAKELRRKGKKILVTTTMAIYNPEKYDYYFLKNIDPSFKANKGTITILGDRVLDSKLRGVSSQYIDYISSLDIFDFILVEADGSKKKPIKAPRIDEPIIPKSTEKTIGLIGMDSLDRAINHGNVHRPELFLHIVGKKLEDKIEDKDIVKLVLDSNGLFKNSQGQRILILNKVTTSKLDTANKLKRKLEKDIDKIFIVMRDEKN